MTSEINKSANAVRNISWIQRENMIIFLTPLADIYSCSKHKVSFSYKYLNILKSTYVNQN